MMLNDRYGCCTCATPGHMIQVATAANGKQVTIPDAEILRAYKAINPGFREDDPGTDTGAFVVDALDYWRDQGFRDAAGRVHKILGRATVDMANPLEVMQGVARFGGVYFGLGLPLSAQDQASWRVDLGAAGAEVGSWGGHATSLHAYRRGHEGTFITWGADQPATFPWIYAYADEAYVVVTEDWADADGAPNGLDKAQLLADLRAF